MSALPDVDVLVVGAGISGIGAGYYLQQHCPNRSYTILEGRSDLGGTWDLFRYPGIRSDSDMYTLGYSFKPWTGDMTMADGPSIKAYVEETCNEFGIRQHIEFNHHVHTAHWTTETSTWTVIATNETGEDVRFTCNFLFMCSGYYSYAGGYTPDFAGREDFDGTIVHPQDWPDDLNYADKSVVVIGSGATAVTLVPAMANEASHVTMLQRSPSYIASRPAVDTLAQKLRRALPAKVAYAATRFKNILQADLVYRKTRTNPDLVKDKLLDGVRAELGSEYPIEPHFSPTYDPWDQRLCFVPDGDLFKAINAGRASVVTDRIDRFSNTGILLESGDEIDADIIVTATGLQLVTLGEVHFTVDGEPIDFSKTWTYRGLAYSDIPNLVSSFGYINASWTLRVDLTCAYVCRLLNHMSTTGATMCTPRLRPEDAGMPERPWIDDFSSGYMQRMMPLLPRQGDRQPWLNSQDYLQERRQLRKLDVDDGVMSFQVNGAGTR